MLPIDTGQAQAETTRRAGYENRLLHRSHLLNSIYAQEARHSLTYVNDERFCEREFWTTAQV